MCARKVKVLSSESIGIVFKFLPSGKEVAFFQGEIINSSHSFQKYQNTDYDRIAVIHKDQMLFQTEQFWKKITEQNKEKKRIFEAFEDPTIKREISRQQDLILFRIDNNQRSYFNSISKVRFLTEEIHENSFPTCLTWNPAEQPLETTLPVL
jgi:hypothetical protein